MSNNIFNAIYVLFAQAVWKNILEKQVWAKQD